MNLIRRFLHGYSDGAECTKDKEPSSLQFTEEEFERWEMGFNFGPFNIAETMPFYLKHCDKDELSIYMDETIAQNDREKRKREYAAADYWVY